MAYFLGVDTGGTYTDAVIVDEADSVLIDQAATPFILSAGEAILGGLDTLTLRQMLDMAKTLRETRDYMKSEALRRVVLTDEGKDRLAALAVGGQGLVVVGPVRNHLAAQALVVHGNVALPAGSRVPVEKG